MTRVSIRHIEVIRAANIAAVLYAVIAIVFSLVFLSLFVLAAMFGTQVSGMDRSVWMGAGIFGGMMFMVFGAVFYAIVGWIFTAIAVALFNFAAGRLGGLQADIVFESLPPGPGAVAPYGYPPTYGGGQPPTPPANWGQPQGG